MLRSNLCDSSDAYILVKGTISITGGPNNAADANKRFDERDKGATFKNCPPFVKWINNKQHRNR